jgi:hypothetical protein
VHARTAFHLSLARPGGAGAARVRLAVHDASPLAPSARALDSASTSGRGMHLVAALASDWGVDSHAGRKSVWVELAAG